MRQHEIQIRVRYSETDAMGFLHHANYFSYFEVGRTELFRAQGGDYRAMEEGGLFLVVAKLDCRYRQPARYDDLLMLRTTISAATEAKLEHEYEIFRDGTLLATGHSTLACVDRAGKLQRMPAELLQMCGEDA
ncbi:MAG TPA: thioesterase family protein [Planctomycetaceae bacterium]|nr:thioesterase family protein [Planctomycetaceae bacterium]